MVEAARHETLKKLHALSGVLPLGAFVVIHIWVTSAVTSSRDVYDRQIGWLHSGWFLGLLEIVLVVAPLLYHAVYGTWRSLQPRDPDHAYDTDLMVSLERASGVVVLVFVAAHFWEFRGQTWNGSLPVSSYASKLVEDLSSTQRGVPWIATGYFIGIAATCFHLVNGMTSFLTTWGYTRAETARRRARIFMSMAGVTLFVISCGIVLQLATGVRYFPVEEPKAPLCGPSAAPAITPLAPRARASSSSATATTPATSPAPTPSISNTAPPPSLPSAR